MLNKISWVVFVILSTVSFYTLAVEKNTPIIEPFTAQYTISHKSVPVNGTATRTLNYLKNDQIEYSYKTKGEWLIFSDFRSETSIVNINDYQLTPFKYQYKREGTGKDKSYNWSYDVINNKAHNIKKNKTVKIDFPDNIQDKLSYHLQSRIDLLKNPQQKQFIYPVISTSGSIQSYAYQYDGEEELMLPYGLVKAIRLKREVPDKEKVVYAWFAPELNYLLVKLHQEKSGIEQFGAQLNSVTINTKNIENTEGSFNNTEKNSPTH